MPLDLSKLCYNPFSRISGPASYLSRPANIITGLFLLSALCWIIHRATGLNFRSPSHFPNIGDKALRLFCQIFSNPQKPSPKTTTSSTTAKPDVPQPENHETAVIPPETSNDQLLQMMVFVPDNEGKQKLDEENPQNKEIQRLLLNRICHEFNQHAKRGAAEVARALAPLFALAKGDPDRFMLLVSLVIFWSRYCPRFIANVLEEVEWPSDALKQEKLPVFLAFRIEHNCIEWQDDSIEIGQPSAGEAPTFFRTFRLCVVTKRIFGHGDFVNNPPPLSPFLVQGMGIAIHDCAETAVEDLKQKYKDGQTNEETKIGFNLVIGQFMECRFPCTMLAPLLPYLTNLPGLVGLEMNDVGGSGLVTQQHGGQKIGYAFRDEDAPALLDIFRSNPHLFHIEVNTDGMTPKGERQFVKEMQAIIENRERPKTIEGFLRELEPPKEQ